MSKASFDSSESIAHELRHSNPKEAGRELSRDYRIMKPEDFKHVFDSMNSQLKIANLPEVKAHYGKNGKIESFDFGTPGEPYKTEKPHKRQEHVGNADDKKEQFKAVEQPRIEAKKDQPKPEVKKEDPKPEAKKDQPKPEEKKEQPKPEAKKDKPTSDSVADVTYDASGTRVTKFGDGTVKRENPDKTTSVVHPDGSVHHYGPKDGDKFYWNNKEKSLTTTDAKGNTNTKWENGVQRQQNVDGTGFVRNADGSEKHWGPSATQNYEKTANGGTLRVAPDGTKTTTWEAGGGPARQIIENKDGTSGTIYQNDGRVVTWSPKPDLSKFGR
ncbi:hypothetical protein BH10CYA1_BH10CYA1_23880 [soil metagenome]